MERIISFPISDDLKILTIEWDEEDFELMDRFIFENS